ncbi:MAG TPA: amino acid permease, partial [Candidatus Sulfopaludibacter sp.]|nr:amino acid permease [Candidatus Sulfopaludibacter sp.]
ERVGRISPRTGAPVAAIVLQGLLATAIALLGRYEQILNFEVSVDFISFAITAAALFVLRRRPDVEGVYRAPGHPYTTAIFVLSCATIVASTVWHNPLDTFMGQLILLSGIPVYWYWSRRR